MNLRFCHSSSLVWSLILSALVASATPALARGRTSAGVDPVTAEVQGEESIQVPAAGTLEVAFSPNEGGEALVIKVIDAARGEIRMLAYSFTNARVAEALLRAKKRHVDVQILVDYKHNITEDRSGKARAALSALANAGIDVRTVNAFPIHHDKVICIDGDTVELGSFNYSDAAAKKNSENVLVNWHNPTLAKAYLSHFHRNYQLSTAYQVPY